MVGTLRDQGMGSPMNYPSDVQRAWAQLSQRWDAAWASDELDGEQEAARAAMRQFLAQIENTLARQQSAIEGLQRELETLRFRQTEPIVVGQDW